MRSPDEVSIIRNKLRKLEDSQLHLVIYILEVYFNKSESIGDSSEEGKKLLKEQNLNFPEGKILVKDIEKLIKSEIQRRGR